jgi:hypothetical protein
MLDSSATLLNLILAKGEIMTSRIQDILVNFRTFLHTRGTDVSMFYKILYLIDWSLLYSLFIFFELMSIKDNLSVFVRMQAYKA